MYVARHAHPRDVLSYEADPLAVCVTLPEKTNLPLAALGFVVGGRLPESVSLRGKRYDLCILYKDLTDRYDFSVKRSYAKPGLYPSVDVQKAKSPKLKVRGYRPEDQLKLEKFAIHPNVIRRVGLLFAGLSPWPAGSGPPYQEMVNSGRSYPLVCEDETTGEPIGVLWLFASSQDVMQHVMELGMGVKPEYQGIGVGTMLMENMKTLAKRLHLTRVNLTVFEDNVPAQHLYRKTGFVECGKIPGWLQERYVSETYMTLKLK